MGPVGAIASLRRAGTVENGTVATGDTPKKEEEQRRREEEEAIREEETASQVD